MDRVQRAHVDRAYASRSSDDFLIQLDNRSRGYNALKNQTAVDDGIRSILASACYRARKLNFGDDARGEVRPKHELLLDHG